MNQKNIIYPFQSENKSYGKLLVKVNNEMSKKPVENATVRIYNMKNQSKILEETQTNISGQTLVIELLAPPVYYSMEPYDVLPYEPYILQISAPDFQTVEIYGTQIFPEVLAIQPVNLSHASNTIDTKKIIIGAHTLSGYYPPSVVTEIEKEIINTDEPVIIPDHLIVHTGIPSDTIVPNLCTGYKDYIKNVVSNEIYPTWPIETIYANIFATLSFTLNRFYTNWYPGQGYDFNITDTNVFDNKWIYGRNYYDNISNIVDSFFYYYLSKPGITQPLLTPYCKGALIKCRNMMEKWISKDLGTDGYQAINILRYFFGESLYLNSTNNNAGVSYLWPGVELSIGFSGDAITIIQDYLNNIATVYPEIPVNKSNGIYSKTTEEAVKVYQRIFSLPITGKVDVGTWYSIMLFFNKYNNTVLRC
ncbi:peptidoglycan-binding domain-containing protein [Anaerocolumna sp. MB42-C2]|uniref:peptidoglycan-binding domain-containing protein n=1 Tax=Anaerocolumna sp. MB42-C2 TaxID=3070997 RepID=UPI0027E08D7B|nr:peptidoglycan-binding domain-containing protein [Anaerocolumna sp. MB42-C2]WMJ87247.1 peptidoglycan-binding domain-containing protein [Anaerocolumna sp. MB42-C2]